MFAEDNSVIIAKVCHDMELDTENILSCLDIECMGDENLSKEVELRSVFVN
ncbi:magnesium ABC transporter ATPase [Xenorhabdus cabanillasii]|uniref:magnesium ABC transporter ATPase n=1 Tax=Xenorhabdus cabanillasii TaxID=351673 RepID=UPI001E5C6FA0|nr:magnesium ABC transporter ATPase [Xenorhabdus cabanillasii]